MLTTIEVQGKKIPVRDFWAINFAPKYEIIPEDSVMVDGHTLYRVKSIRHDRKNGQFHADDLGGYIESEKNLSHLGSCWVASGSYVYGASSVEGDAWIRNSSVKNSVIGGSATLDHATLEDCQIEGSATLKPDGFAKGSSGPYLHNVNVEKGARVVIEGPQVFMGNVFEPDEEGYYFFGERYLAVVAEMNARR